MRQVRGLVVLVQGGGDLRDQLQLRLGLGLRPKIAGKGEVCDEVAKVDGEWAAPDGQPL